MNLVASCKKISQLAVPLCILKIFPGKSIYDMASKFNTLQDNWDILFSHFNELCESSCVGYFLTLLFCLKLPIFILAHLSLLSLHK